ncbi:hypothetical protein QBC42DRAFT_232002 [Cladorrhinum samala]|uniref:Rhodopsin domain-containing protein n=1 Tax=Cladorrhinum samala TaxID=585594 RepID=A0AAV9HGU4_9PEZI|nr:hypothetical protein QBC42DRAFT_232002 [Cladorrhinum samala]
MALSDLARRDTAEAATPRVVPNYAPMLLGSIWAVTIVSALFLSLRIYCKVTRHRLLWWDDHFLILSWICVLVSTAMLTEGTKYGIGMHYEDMEYTKMPMVALISYSAGFANILAAAWSKTSFGITLLRISSGWDKWLIWFIILSVNIVLGVSAAIMWTRCWPVAKLWHPEIEGTCWTTVTLERYQTFTSVYSGIMDIVLAILPWKIIWNLTINKQEKVGALAAMSMGVFSGIVAFMKIISLSDITDSSSTTVDLKIFGTAEPAMSVVAASIPILRAFIRRGSVTKPQSIEFVQLSPIPEPSNGRSAPSVSDSKRHFDNKLVKHTSRPSQTSVSL